MKQSLEETEKQIDDLQAQIFANVFEAGVKAQAAADKKRCPECGHKMKSQKKEEEL